MAIILVLMGGIIGLASAIASFVLLEVGILLAIGIWSGVGITSALLAMLVAFAPQAGTAPQRAAERA